MRGYGKSKGIPVCSEGLHSQLWIVHVARQTPQNTVYLPNNSAQGDEVHSLPEAVTMTLLLYLHAQANEL